MLTDSRFDLEKSQHPTSNLGKLTPKSPPPTKDHVGMGTPMVHTGPLEGVGPTSGPFGTF
jgi:hypothetical protein